MIEFSVDDKRCTRCGLLKMTLEIVPDLKPLLGLPASHAYYGMLFGTPAIRFARTVQRDDAAQIPKGGAVKRMSFTLDNVMPWGRSFDEYVGMFSLSDADLQNRILGCGDGPASFNALLTKRGGCVVSVDPLYGFPVNDIRRRIRETYSEVMEQTRRNRHEFTWKSIKAKK